MFEMITSSLFCNEVLKPGLHQPLSRVVPDYISDVMLPSCDDSE